MWFHVCCIVNNSICIVAKFTCRKINQPKVQSMWWVGIFVTMWLKSTAPPPHPPFLLCIWHKIRSTSNWDDVWNRIEITRSSLFGTVGNRYMSTTHSVLEWIKGWKKPSDNEMWHILKVAHIYTKPCTTNQNQEMILVFFCCCIHWYSPKKKNTSPAFNAFSVHSVWTLDTYCGCLPNNTF